MATQVSTTELKLEAALAEWGREECRSILFVDDVAGSLEDEYFDLNVMDVDGVETQYYVWLDGGTGTDPAIAGKTGLQLTYTNGDDAATLAGLYVALIASLSVTTSVSGATVTVENKFIREVTAEVYTNAPSLTGTQLRAGFGGSLGGTNDGIELSVETQSTELKVNQKGEIVIGEIYQGSAASIAMSLAEMNKDRWETIVGGVTGDVFTPSGGTRLVGNGTSRLFQNLFDLGGKLILHPIRLPSADRTEDVVFWKSAPKPESISYSGTEQQGMSVTFTAYNDTSKPEEISLWAQGDWTQDLV